MVVGGYSRGLDTVGVRYIRGLDTGEVFSYKPTIAQGDSGRACTYLLDGVPSRGRRIPSDLGMVRVTDFPDCDPSREMRRILLKGLQRGVGQEECQPLMAPSSVISDCRTSRTHLSSVALARDAP